MAETSRNSTSSLPLKSSESLKERVLGPTIREQLDTVENFKQKIEQVQIFLDAANVFVKPDDKKTDMHDGFQINNITFLFGQYISRSSEMITELKNSKAPISPESLQKVLAMEKYRDDILLYAGKMATKNW